MTLFFKKRNFTMDQRFYLILIATSFIAINAAAETLPIETPSTQPNRVESTAASGEKEITIIDESGNLKIIEKSTQPTLPSVEKNIASPPSTTPSQPPSDATNIPGLGQPPMPSLPPPESKQLSTTPQQNTTPINDPNKPAS